MSATFGHITELIPPLTEVEQLRARVAELEAQLATTRFVALLRTPPAPAEPRHGWDAD